MVYKKPKEKLKRIDGKEKNDLIGGRFSILTILNIWFRSTTLIQGSFNYAYFQGTGYSQVMFPFFKRIYRNNKEKFKQALIDNIEFYNTGPLLGSQVVTTLHLYMLQTGCLDKDVKKIKFALMGPLAGIHDAFFNFGIGPLIAGMAASLSASGSWSGIIFMYTVGTLSGWLIVIPITFLTYKSGQRFISDLSSIMSALVKLSSMVGITIIAALSLVYTHINIAAVSHKIIVYQGQIAIKTVEFQNTINKLLPYLLQVILIGTSFFLMTKYNWSIYKIIVAILIFGINGYVFGIF